MKKSWIIILVVAIIIIGIVAGLAIYNKNEKAQNNIVENEINKVSEKVTDECTEEYEEFEKQAMICIFGCNFFLTFVTPLLYNTIKQTNSKDNIN